MASQVVYATFASREASDVAVTTLARRTDGHEPFSLQLHRDHLDSLTLPEAATQVGRNTLVAAGAGGLIGLVMGVVGGSVVHIAGLTPASAGAIGMVTGVLIGLMSAIMSGARDPKPDIAALVPKLAQGAVIVTVEVHDGAQAEYVEDLLDEHGASDVGRC